MGSSPASAEVVNEAPPLSVRVRSGLPTGLATAPARSFPSLGCPAVAEEGCEGVAVSGSQRWGSSEWRRSSRPVRGRLRAV